MVAASRELRDRFLEEVNANELLIEGKYEVSRVLEDRRRVIALPAPLAA